MQEDEKRSIKSVVRYKRYDTITKTTLVTTGTVPEIIKSEAQDKQERDQ